MVAAMYRIEGLGTLIAAAMGDCTRVLEHTHEYARVRPSTHEYARVRTSTLGYARVRSSTHEYARVRSILISGAPHQSKAPPSEFEVCVSSD